MFHKLPNISFLISGRGSNMVAIIRRIKKRQLKAKVSLVFSDQPNTIGLQAAKKLNCETATFSANQFSSKNHFDTALVNILKEKKTDLVVCAGYMRILKKPMLNAFREKIVNIHPSLLPAFPGLKAQRQALQYGVKFTGCTVHFVDEGVDTGPIISQRVVAVKQNDTESSLAKRILKEEHDLYWQSLKKIL